MAPLASPRAYSKGLSSSTSEDANTPSIVSNQPWRRVSARRQLSRNSAMRYTFFKTELCRYYEPGQQGLRCETGLGCPFAHGEQELLTRPDLTKTTLCQLFRKGKCAPSRMEQRSYAPERHHSYSPIWALKAMTWRPRRSAAAAPRARCPLETPQPLPWSTKRWARAGRSRRPAAHGARGQGTASTRGSAPGAVSGSSRAKCSTWPRLPRPQRPQRHRGAPT